MERTTRRRFLWELELLGAAALASPLLEACDASNTEFRLRALQTTANLLPGRASNVWTLRGEVASGPAERMVSHGAALGPTLHVRKGERVRIAFENQLNEATTVHCHGFKMPHAMDGQPNMPIGPGQSYDYEFEVRNDAGTYFYHAHPHGRTGEQVYRGLAGLILVHDEREDALALPRAEYDIPLVLQDRVFDANNQLVYAPAMMRAMSGWLGDRVLVNCVPDFVLHAATRPYRLRLVNASNARIYRLAWQDGTPLTVIGTDGGLLERPVTRAYAMLGPGERLELWADFSGRALGSELSLVSLAFEAGSTGGMGGMATTGSAQGAPLTIFKVKLDRASAERLPLPEELVAIPRYRELDASNAGAPRRIVIGMQNMTFTLNGRTYQMDERPEDDRVQLGALEVWEFDNRGAGMGGMMAMPHAMHVHATQFQVLGRTGVTHQGYVDEGWKDTVLLMPGETAKVALRFSDYTGLYLYHCHNLEHEDRGMMLNFVIEPPS